MKLQLSNVLPSTGLIIATSLLFPCTSILAGPIDQAKRMHDRIAGVPPSAEVLEQMRQAIADDNPEDAAAIALENQFFYSVTLKNFAAPMSNIDGDVFVPLNDYIATVIGIVRDDKDYRGVLFENILYTANDDLGVESYSNSSNNHYEQLERLATPLKESLVERRQSDVTGLDADATAGVLTSRAAAKAYFFAGTNRANFRFTLMNYMCKDLEQVKDISLPPDRIRQDVSRSPGGDSRIFNNSCIGCHTGMDPMAQAFAYYDYVYDQDTDPTGELGRLDYNSAGETDPSTGTRVKAKYHFNSATFSYGYVTPNDSWENYWRQGQNQNLGWSSVLPGKGQGAKTMGQEIAYSQQFARCQVEKVFKDVCLKPPKTTDEAQIGQMVTSFQDSGYKLKQVFVDTAVYCMGD